MIRVKLAKFIDLFNKVRGSLAGFVLRFRTKS